MALTESLMFPLGDTAPDFQLLDPCDGQIKSLDELAGPKGIAVMFWCNHCPYVKHVESQVLACARVYHPYGIHFVAINSNDVKAYPEDSPEQMVARVEAKGYPFAYLIDPTQAVARAYRAACTPDIMLFDGERLCVYRGRVDATRPGSRATGQDFRAALDALLRGERVPEEDQHPSVGCSIKWCKAR